jgi:hypothetical protein
MSLRMPFAIGAFVLALLAAGWAIVSVLQDRAAAPETPLDIQIGRARLALPAGYIRNPESRRAGEFLELDLAASARDFRPVKGPGKLRPGMEDASADIVYLTIREQDKAPDPAERPARLYMRFLEKDEWSHPGGLIMRRFEAGSPFGREDLYLAPPEGRLFAARCIRPAQPPDGLPNTCIAEMREHGLDIRLRFSPNLLAEWEQIVMGVRGLMKAVVR